VAIAQANLVSTNRSIATPRYVDADEAQRDDEPKTLSAAWVAVPTSPVHARRKRFIGTLLVRRTLAAQACGSPKRNADLETATTNALPRRYVADAQQASCQISAFVRTTETARSEKRLRTRLRFPACAPRFFGDRTHA